MLSDIKYALRMLAKAPGFTVIAVLTLILGIGANSAIFSVINTVLLQPLSFPRPAGLIAVWSRVPNESEKETGSFPDYADLRDQSQAIDALFSYTQAATVLGTGGEAREIRGLAVTSDMFRVLDVPPLLGRAFTREEETKGAQVIVLTYEAWKRYGNGDPGLIGREMICSLRPYTVIGVMPPGYQYPVGGASEYFMPLQSLVTDQVRNRGSHFLRLVGRLKPGATVGQASAELGAISSHLQGQYPDTNTGRAYYVMTLHDDIVGDVRPALLTLVAAVALVLLIACANVANLLLARATQRRREIAIRTALGASRARIVRQLLAEGFLLALGGAIGGLLLAWWGVDLLRTFGPNDVPRLADVRIDSTVIVFSLVIAVASTLLFAVFPALQVSRPNVNEALREGDRGAIGPESHRLRAMLVVSQVALSMLLLAGAGLLIKSFGNLRATNPGFEPSRMLTQDISLPRSKYADAPLKQQAFFQQLETKLRQLPGVDTVGGAEPLPFSGNDAASSFWISGRPDPGMGNHPNASHLTVMGDYFRAMHIPLLKGRAFAESDTRDSTQVIMVNETFARKFFEGKDALGERVLIDSDKGTPAPREIVGIVGNTRHESLAIEPIPEFYVPFAQDPNRRMNMVIRTANETLSGLATAVRSAMHEIDADVYVPPLEPLEKLIGTTLAQPRFNMMLLGVFAGAAMLLAAIGIYGVIAYSVAQRTREIGIRMALGAQKGDMLRLILRQSFTIIGLGLVIGSLAALAVTRLMASLLYGVSAHDFSIYAVVAVALSAAAAVAGYVPARRAMRVDPIVALRYE